MNALITENKFKNCYKTDSQIILSLVAQVIHTTYKPYRITDINNDEINLEISNYIVVKHTDY